VSREGDTLRIDVTLSTGWLFRRRRGANTTLVLQPGPGVLDFDLGAGDVQLRGVAADEIRVSTGAGVIGSVASTGTLNARAGAGKVTIYSHRGEVHCNTGTGDALVDIADAPPGVYRIDVGIGRADLRFPPEAQVHPDVRSGIGRGRQGFTDAGPEAPIRATVSAGIGEASIKRREASEAPRATETPTSRQRAARKSGVDSRQAEELRILQLLEQGRLSVSEAGELIAALHGTSALTDSAPAGTEEEEGNGPAADPPEDS
ncbi:MAG: hypothetical protein ACE5EF_12885, partial [Dehalococcoidia bacterium]